MKTEVTSTTLVDLLVVLKGLPQDEIRQIEAFSGRKFDPEAVAMGTMNAASMMWTIRLKTTGEPLVVGGYVQTGPVSYRSFFLANQRAWDEFGRAVTVHTVKTIRNILDQFEHVRLETLCLGERGHKVMRWYEAIGLRYEATLHGYGVNGETAVLYSAIKGARNY